MAAQRASLRAVGSPVVRSSIALIINTGLNGILGLAYWVAAARLLPVEIVGAGAAGVSSVMFVASLGWAGLQFMLLRYVPVAGRATRRFAVTAYVVALIVGMIAGAIFLVASQRQPELAYLSEDVAACALFLGAIAFWVVFSLQDAVLVGVGRAAWVPIENLVFGLTKLGLLVALASLTSPWVLVVSWFGATVGLVFIVNALLAHLTERDATPVLPPVRRLGRFTVEQHAITILVAAPDSLVPLITLATLGPSANAFYYAAWTVSFSLRLIVVNIGSALTAEGSRASVDRASASRHATRLAAALIAPIIISTVIVAPLILRIYGPDYEVAVDALRLFAVGLVPFTVVTLFIARQRVAERGTAAVVVAGLATTITLALDVLLLPVWGITATGTAWLIGWSVAAIPILAWDSRLRAGPVRPNTTNRSRDW